MNAMQVRELADVLARYGEVLCRPSVELEPDEPRARLVLEFTTSTQIISDGASALDLYYELRRACAVANMRMLAMELGIPAEALERMLAEGGA